jgi:hypothetical protein
MERYSLADLRRLLTRYQAFVAHCAGFAKGTGNATTDSYGYLERLAHAIAHADDWELSCSTIKKGDVFAPFGRANYTGPLGLVLFPLTTQSIVGATPGDGGSWIDPCNPGRRLPRLPPSCIEEIEQSIVNRPGDRYNEIRVYRYQVLGIFISRPVQFSTPTGLDEISDSEIRQGFPHKRVFLLCKGSLYSSSFSAPTDAFRQEEQITIEQLYQEALEQ